MSSETEMRRAFLDAQDQLVQAQQRKRMITAQMESKKREVNAAEFTLDFVNGIPSTSATYLSVGRMFLKQSNEEVKNQLKLQRDSATDAMKMLESNRTTMDRTIGEKENAMRELLIAKARMG